MAVMYFKLNWYKCATKLQWGGCFATRWACRENKWKK